MIAFGWFLTLGLRFVLPAILPSIKVAFAINNATAGLAITVIWAGYAIMQFPAGVLVDRLGERRLLSVSLVLAGGSLGAISGAPVFSVFVVAAGLFGLGTGLFGTSRGIALSNLFSPNPGRAFGITLAAGSVGSAALPFLASVLTLEIGWRLTVGLSVPLFLATGVGTWWVMPAATADADGEPEYSHHRILGPLRVALADRAIGIGVVGLTLMLFTFQALTAFLPTYLVQEKGLSQQMAGALFAVLFVAGAGFQLVGGSAADRVGTRAVLVGVAFVGIFTLAALPVVHGVPALVGLLVVLASRLAVAPVANAYVLEALPDERMGAVWGLLRTGFFLVSSTGAVVVGVLSDRGLFDEAFFLLAGVTAVATALFVYLPKRPGREPT
ncbi:MFS transporter [Halorussus salinisoli]|uniref:MFS transporter n=1 Tax=Halorussus salinisoli TaxID=2558242 RepID=UPI002A90C373|nr:MFS transporter [Halorussus salinisoli]